MSLDYEITYADTVEEGTALANRIGGLADRCPGVLVGFDTEFYGVNLGKESTPARATLHFASLAWDPGGKEFHPRGFPVPDAAVVSRTVVKECGAFRALLSRKDICFAAHNAPVDIHVLGNEGIEVGHVVNTLTLGRWVYPGRARAQWGGGGFTLDALAKDLLGEGKLDTFDEVFSVPKKERTPRTVVTRGCECGVPRCRKRTLPEHSKFQREETVWEERELVEIVPLSEVVPGHSCFERGVRYAAQDAVLAFALYHVLTRAMTKQERLVPWLPNLDLGKRST